MTRNLEQLPTKLSTVLTTYTKTTILVVAFLTVLIGFGVPMVEQDTDLEQFETETDAALAQEYIAANFTTPERQNQTIVQVIQRGENVLSQESLIASLEFQRQLVADDAIRRTLADGNAIHGVANVLANAHIQRQTDDPGEPRPTAPSLEQQIEALEELTTEELHALIEAVLGPDADPGTLSLLASSYEPGSPTAVAHNTIIIQEGAIDGAGPEADVPPRVTDAQLEIRALAEESDLNLSVFGFAMVFEEIDQSLGDSGAIVGPLALLFVVLVLTIAYRDLLDIILGVLGIFAVLVWTFGFMGWMGINFNQVLISVPVLLIGLSIDYAIHVFMRHREHRETEGDCPNIRGSMTIALAGVGVALVWVTVTAAIGFLANLTSPIGPLRDFGLASAFGVIAALIIFAGVIPALKIELDSLLERRGFDRKKRAFGTGQSRISSLLTSGAIAARRFPVLIVVLALVLTAGGAYGATQVDTSFSQEDFLADDPPAWMKSLPEPLAPGDYRIKSDLEFIQANFQQEGNEAEILLRGDVTNDQILRWIALASEDLAERDSIFRLPTGEADVRSPNTVMAQTAAARPNSSFADSYRAAQAESEDGIPDRNIEALFDELLAINPAAAEVVHRTPDGEFRALRITVAISGAADSGDVADDVDASAGVVERASDGQVSAVSTGDEIVFHEIEADLFATVLQGLLITLVAVFIFLTVAYRVTGNPASLGFVTLLPVAFAVSWILGSMWVLDIPFNALTGTITSLTIGLGIAYSIHISSRFQLELTRTDDVWEAMQTTVTGTGGALLGSAGTTVGGFGTLVFAILPVLRQFGIITGLTIIYAFLASVLVLPSLLVLWMRFVGPVGDGSTDDERDEVDGVRGRASEETSVD